MRHIALGSPVPLVGVPLGSWPFARIRGELAPGAWEPLELACEDARALLGGRTLWAINSTARGGGVAEMQRSCCPTGATPVSMPAGSSSQGHRPSSV